ncbi:MAG: hypothetical protein KJ558_05035 [Gammaproteobacteria bacterium]|nr:hypothetical protein [Gammaproteobacteria bacterium]MBU1654183.1 hypothetical protein [Gammaproteobacteria bacterium]MBU1961815.1 hypothetical protein [Gammaproteobacteria bacterium]
MKAEAPLLFVYNADSGLFNTLADIGHKIFSPGTYQCDLCALTHGYFQERIEWRAFVESLGVECRFSTGTRSVATGPRLPPSCRPCSVWRKADSFLALTGMPSPPAGISVG